jgi:hypothetical protein
MDNSARKMCRLSFNITAVKCKTEKKVLTPKLVMTELWVLCTAQLSIEIYLPTNFHVDISYRFLVKSRTRFFLKVVNLK